jgi:hypothetical protein
VIVTLQHPLLMPLGSSSRSIQLGNGKVRAIPAGALPATAAARKNPEQMH